LINYDDLNQLNIDIDKTIGVTTPEEPLNKLLEEPYNKVNSSDNVSHKFNTPQLKTNKDVTKKDLTTGRISLGSLSSNGGSHKVKINSKVNVGSIFVNPFTTAVINENSKSDGVKGFMRKKSMDIRKIENKK
jgi:hypothetical protein